MIANKLTDYIQREQLNDYMLVYNILSKHTLNSDNKYLAGDILESIRKINVSLKKLHKHLPDYREKLKCIIKDMDIYNEKTLLSIFCKMYLKEDSRRPPHRERNFLILCILECFKDMKQKTDYDAILDYLNEKNFFKSMNMTSFKRLCDRILKDAMSGYYRTFTSIHQMMGICIKKSELSDCKDFVSEAILKYLQRSPIRK